MPGGSSHHDFLPAIEQLVALVVLQTLIGSASTYTTMQQQPVTELVQRHASRPVTEVATTIALRTSTPPSSTTACGARGRRRWCGPCR